MLEFYVRNQTLKLFTPVIAADTLKYLTCKVYFDDSEWDGYTRWLHFRQEREGEDALVYDLLLNADDETTEEQTLNLTIGEWEIYLTGTGQNENRLTTLPLIVTVKESGLVDAPLHVIPLSVAEQLDAKAELALSYVLELRRAAERGEFTGKGFSPLGYFDTLEELLQNVTSPEAGDSYGVGTNEPYTYYMWDAVNERWVNAGQIKGAKGDSGAVFTPSVDAGGNLSWSNNGGLVNPTARNIMGPKGETGATGPAGASAYDKAVEAGYTGTEASFYSSLSSMPSHAARHASTGADPITVKTGNLESGAVTAGKIAAGAVSASFTGTLTAAGWTGSAAPYSQALTVTGLLATDKPIVDVVMSGTYATDGARDEAWGAIYRAVPTANTLTVYAKEKPTVALPIQILCVRK